VKYGSIPQMAVGDLLNPHDIEINIQLKLPAPSSSFRAPGIPDARNAQSQPSGSRKLTLDEYKRKRGMV